MRLGSDDSQVRDRLSPARTRAEGTGMCVGRQDPSLVLTYFCISAWGLCTACTGTLTNQMNPAPAYASRSHRAAQPASSCPSYCRLSSASRTFSDSLSVKHPYKKMSEFEGTAGVRATPLARESTSWSPSACRHCETLRSLP
jgi:hypothetical protein